MSVGYTGQTDSLPPRARRPAAFSPPPMHKKNAIPELDDFDRRILAIYQHDTRITAATIGSRVGLSGAAVQRRLKRLRETGVIVAETARLSGKALGLPVTCIVGVDLRDESTREM